MLELSGMDQLEEGTYRLTIKAVFNDGTSIKKHYNVKIGEDQPYYPPVGDESGMINIDRIYVNANELDSGIDVKGDYPIRITEGDKMYILGWALGDNEYLREIVYKIDFGADISCSDNYTSFRQMIFSNPPFVNKRVEGLLHFLTARVQLIKKQDEFFIMNDLLGWKEFARIIIDPGDAYDILRGQLAPE